MGFFQEPRCLCECPRMSVLFFLHPLAPKDFILRFGARMLCHLCFSLFSHFLHVVVLFCLCVVFGDLCKVILVKKNAKTARYESDEVFLGNCMTSNLVRVLGCNGLKTLGSLRYMEEL